MDPIEQAQEIASILVSRFEADKYNSHFTPWGVAYYWNSSEKRLSDGVQDNEFTGFVDFLLDRPSVRRSFLRLPKMQQATHNMVTCATNAEVISRVMQNLAPRLGLDEILSEARLMKEAAEVFVNSKSQVHFWEFLLRYDAPSAQLGDSGSYRPMFERLYLRAGEESISDCVNSLIPVELQARIAEQNERLESQAPLEGPLADLVKGLPKGQVANVRIPKSNIAGYLGKIKTHSSGNSSVIDWEDFLDQRRRQERLNTKINYEEWARELVYLQESAKAWALFEEDKQAALDHFRGLAGSDPNEELRRAYGRIAEDMEMVLLFDNTNHLYRTMTVNMGRKK